MNNYTEIKIIVKNKIWLSIIYQIDINQVWGKVWEQIAVQIRDQVYTKFKD